MGKILGLGALFIGGLMLADALTHPTGVKQLGSSANTLVATGGNQLIGIGAKSG